MILADTSVWAEHIARPVQGLQGLLQDQRILMHPFIIGELACGNLPDRARMINALQSLRRATQVDGDDVLLLLEKEKLFGTGIGWVDAHLLASARFDNARLWSFDKRLSAAAHELDIAQDT